MKKTIGNNKLSLNKDTLRKLTASDLSQVQGAGGVGFSRNPICQPSARPCVSTNPPKTLC